MKRAGKVKWAELKVGIIIALGAITMIYVSFRGGGTSLFESKIDYVLYCNDLDGLVVGSPVWLAGVEVGNVNRISFLEAPIEPGKNIEVIIRVKESVTYLMTSGTTAQLGTIGLIGDKYVKLIPGPTSDTSLDGGSVIPSAGKAGIGGALKELPKTISRINSLLESIENILVSLDTAGGTLPMLIKDRELAARISNLIDRTDGLVTTLDEGASSMTRDIHTMSDDFHSLSEELLAGRGTFGKLLKDPAPFDNIVSATARLDTLLQKVNTGEGTAGQLVNDQELYTNMKDMMARLNTLVKDLMDNPKKYFKFSVF
jgi:phospholipid/cholesterol/gamma-HCH transport system substrate-binding protein